MAKPDMRLMTRDRDWDTLRAGFRWPAMRSFNIADACCDIWAAHDPGRLALRYLDADDTVRDYSYGDLARASRRLANALSGLGLARGARIAIMLPQRPETALAHLAAYRMGAVAVPLFTLFGEDGLRHRLADSGAQIVVTDSENLSKIVAIRDDLPELRHVLCVDGRDDGAEGFWETLEAARADHALVRTGPDDHAFISYTSGTTGPSKGALHAHRVLIGHLPGVELSHNFLGEPGDCLWTPADWAWMGGLTDVLLPGLCLGVPVVAHRMPKFDPGRAVALMADLGVRNVFFPPTALKMMRQAEIGPITHLRSVASGGEALGAEMLGWGERAFGTTINEFYGQTECNMVLSNCHEILDVRAGAAGRAVPGHDVAILNEEGREVAPGTPGEIAVRRPDPVMFLEYWQQPEKTAAKFSGDWLLTGDEGLMDEDGYVHFQSRSDDVITSAGYRIGPSEIEDCLCGHEAVAMAAAIGVPDPVRTEIVKAFVVMRDPAQREGLEAALIARVRTRISPHVAPRSVVFVDRLPMTSTGKIQRRALRDAEGRSR